VSATARWLVIDDEELTCVYIELIVAYFVDVVVDGASTIVRVYNQIGSTYDASRGRIGEQYLGQYRTDCLVFGRCSRGRCLYDRVSLREIVVSIR
jgi:hypothetical protein